MKKKRSKARLQQGGAFDVQDVRNLIVMEEEAVQENINRRSQPSFQRAPPTCSACHVKDKALSKCLRIWKIQTGKAFKASASGGEAYV